MRKVWLVFALYVGAALLYTWPLAAKLDRAIYGYAGDNLGAIRYLWWWKYAFQNQLDPRNSFLEQAPFGFKIDSETGSVLYYWPLKILTLLFNEVTAYNLVLVASFPLAAVAMFFFVKFVLAEFGKNNASTLIAFWAGFIYSFSPYHFWKAYNHLDLALIWPMPLALLFFLKSLAAPNRRRLGISIFGSGLFTAATILTNFYYGFFLLIVLLIIAFLYGLIFRSSGAKLFGASFLTVLIGLSFSLIFIAPTVWDAYVNKGRGQSAARVANYQRPLLDVVSLSARPWDYFIPSSDNPFFGDRARRFYGWIKNQGQDFKVISGPVHERTIFLGFTSVFLWLVGLGFFLFHRPFRQRAGRAGLLLFLAAIFLIIVSMPPYFFLKGQYTIYLPSYLLHLLFPVFRTYSRLGIFVLLVTITGSALVVGFLRENLSRKIFGVFFLGVFLLSTAEFLNAPPSKVIDLKMPNALSYLAEQKEIFNFVVYPKEFNVAELLVFQPKFQKGFLNFHSQSEYYALWNYLADFHNPRTPALLSALGIKYAVFQKKLIFNEANPVDDLWYTRALRDPLSSVLPGLTLEKDFEDSAVYRVSAQPLAFIILAREKPEAFPKTAFDVAGSKLRLYFADLRGEDKKEVLLTVRQESLTATADLTFGAENLNWSVVQRSEGRLVLVIRVLKEPAFLEINVPRQKTLDGVTLQVGPEPDLTSKPI